MSETKHTPGPWYYDCDSGGCYFELSAGEEAIIDCCDFCSTPTINNEANARLIAAAPELLEALKALLKLHDDGDYDGPYPAELALAAIAKAEGSTHETP